MKKRILALVLAFMMTASLGYTALAESMPETDTVVPQVETASDPAGSVSSSGAEPTDPQGTEPSETGETGEQPGETGEQADASGEPQEQPGEGQSQGENPVQQPSDGAGAVNSGTGTIEDDALTGTENGNPAVETQTVTAWTWNDEQQVLQQDGDIWGLGLAGVEELNEEIWAEVQTLLPQSIFATVENAAEPVVLALSWTLDGTTAKATLVDPGYVLAETAPALAVTLQVGNTETFTTLPSGTPPFSNREVEGISPDGTTIDLFDYWITSQIAADNDNGDDNSFLNSGINANHALLFGKGMEKYTDYRNRTTLGAWNCWTGSTTPYGGIVSDRLVNGYPQLSVDTSEDYLLSGLRNRNGNESLAYLFDPDISLANGKASYEDVQGLLRVDDNGYYYYDSTQNYAVYYADTNSFTLYRYPGVLPGGRSPVGQFFPFNAANADAELSPGNQLMNTHTSTDAEMNHYFGIHMSTRFVQQFDGHTDNLKGTEVTYDFSGDDDVWIYIDDVLVADLGGIHDAASVSINFATGVISINGEAQNQGLGRILGYNSNTLPNDTYHTLDFFYLERGNTDSNMNLKYNLVSVPESSIIKVDQTGDPVANASFELRMADQNYNDKGLVARDTTDRDGEFVLQDEEGYIVSLQELWDDMNKAGLVYQTADDEKRANLILQESKPAGYRSNATIHLYLVESGNGKVLLLSDNYWQTGAYAYANETISMDGQISYNGGSVDLDRGGTLFAVVLRRNKQSDDPLTDQWSLITGNATNGWHTSDPLESGQNGIQAILNALAQNPDNYFVAQLDASGAYKLTVSDLPGDVMKYYYMLGDNEKNEAEYTVAFYYTTADSVSEADASNTWRVTNSDSDSWSRVFSSNVYVPNIKNRLFVQKFSDTGDTLTGAVFSLYRAEQITVNSDGSYTIAENAEPYDTVTTANLNKAANGVQLDGGGIFPTSGHVLAEGTYYLVETSAPTGYDISTTPVKVIVDDTGVYADAGVADDGIEVSRGVGSIVKSMAQFAALGDIDATLNNIVAKFYTTSSETSLENGNFESFAWRSLEAGTFQPAAGVTYHPTYWYNNDTYTLYDANNHPEEGTALGMHMAYSATTAALEYAPGVEVSGGEAVSLMTTDVGWSNLMIEQCMEHSQALVDKGYAITDLSGVDLTNLFSGTVIVQVTNNTHYDTSLTINKKVDGLDDADVTGVTYTFTVEKLADNGTDVDTSYNGSVMVKVGNADPVEQSFSNGVLTASRNGVGAIQILNLADGNYRVVETSSSPTVVTTGNERYNWTSVSFGEGTDTTATVYVAATATDKDKTVTATNHYEEAMQTLIVHKYVEGNMGDTTKDFSFTLSVTKGGSAYRENLTATKTGEESTTLTVNDAGNYTFTLKDDQQISIDLPYGCVATVTETSVDGYETKSRAYVSTTAAPAYSFDVDLDQQVTLTDNYTIDFQNTMNLDTPITGVDNETPVYRTMIIVGVIGAVIVCGSAFLIWRRRRRDWM